jgi:hypothetical protein
VKRTAHLSGSLHGINNVTIAQLINELVLIFWIFRSLQSQAGQGLPPGGHLPSLYFSHSPHNYLNSRVIAAENVGFNFLNPGILCAQIIMKILPDRGWTDRSRTKWAAWNFRKD